MLLSSRLFHFTNFPITSLACTSRVILGPVTNTRTEISNFSKFLSARLNYSQSLKVVALCQPRHVSDRTIIYALEIVMYEEKYVGVWCIGQDYMCQKSRPRECRMEYWGGTNVFLLRSLIRIVGGNVVPLWKWIFIKQIFSNNSASVQLSTEDNIV